MTDEQHRLIYGLGREIAGKVVDQYLHDLIYYHFGKPRVRDLTGDECGKLVDILEFWEDKIHAGHDGRGRLIIPG